MKGSCSDLRTLLRPKKINVLFPEMSQYFLGSVGREFFFFLFWKFFYIEKHEITLKIEEKFSDVPKKFRVGPKEVGSVRFLETRLFFFALFYSLNSFLHTFRHNRDSQ